MGSLAIIGVAFDDIYCAIICEVYFQDLVKGLTKQFL
jgi:hypothetical protein